MLFLYRFSWPHSNWSKAFQSILHFFARMSAQPRFYIKILARPPLRFVKWRVSVVEYSLPTQPRNMTSKDLKRTCTFFRALGYFSPATAANNNVTSWKPNSLVIPWELKFVDLEKQYDCLILTCERHTFSYSYITKWCKNSWMYKPGIELFLQDATV